MAENLALNLFLYIILLFCAIIITYSLNVFLRSISFWTIEGEAFFGLSLALTRITQYPSDIFYNKAIKFIATFIVPLAFMATVPAKILAHGFDWKLISLSILLTIIFFFLSRRFFYFALRSYESGSS
jgi:ABC-2 type transport system permease protein